MLGVGNGWVGGKIKEEEEDRQGPHPLVHPPTQSQPTVAHSNRLVLLHLSTHPPTHLPKKPSRWVWR